MENMVIPNMEQGKIKKSKIKIKIIVGIIIAIIVIIGDIGLYRSGYNGIAIYITGFLIIIFMVFIVYLTQKSKLPPVIKTAITTIAAIIAGPVMLGLLILTMCVLGGGCAY